MAAKYGGHGLALNLGQFTERDGFVRAGCAAYTTADEVERLLEGVRKLAL